jgi:hypothetical protein
MNMRRVLIVFSVLLLFASLGIMAQDKYVPSSNEVFYGTWINEKMTPQKTVHNPDGSFEDYQHVSDTTPFRKGTSEITKKTTDSEGNVYYETFDKMSFGMVLHSLWKISDSGKAMEMVGRAAGADPSSFPKEIDPKDPHYFIFYRLEN